MENNNKYGENFLGRVIRFISKTELIIDVGEDHLTEGDQIQVYTIADEIFDYEGNSLGHFEYIKDTLDVVQTNTNYSVCEKIKTKTETNGFMAAASLLEPKTINYSADLNIDEKDISPLINKSDSIIKIGDLVKKY